MSKRQYKVQASSSRAIGGGGFGAFGAAGGGGTLSYFVEPPELSAISDANVAVAFKNLSKKDGTTKAKALDDIRSYVQAHPYEQDGGTEEAVLEAWVKFYPRISIDNSRRVRELGHNVLHDLCASVRKRFEKYIPKVVGTWLAGTFDRDRAVARAAQSGVGFLFDSEDKIKMLWRRCQPQILGFAQEAIGETPQTLSDERTMTVEDANAKYFRVIGASLSLVINSLVRSDEMDVAKHQDKYEAVFASNKRLWSFAASKDATLRRTTHQMLQVCLDKQPAFVRANIDEVSRAFIAEALRTSQTSSALQLLQAIARLTTEYPEVWNKSYKEKKPSIVKRLQSFIERGSQGGPPQYWNALQSLLAKLPEGVLPVDLDPSLQLLKSYRIGITNRDEPRKNAESGWLSYLQVVEYLGKSASLGSLFFMESIHPILEQYLHPVTENAQWAIADTDVVVKAYLTCAKGSVSEVQELEKGWTRLVNDFVTRIATSLPEQSKDYQKSQDSIASEGKRWFVLVSKTIPLQPSLVSSCAKIIDQSIKTLQARAGKPHGAAAIVEASLTLCSELITESPAIKAMIERLLKQDLPKMITTPSSSYLISTLRLLGKLQGQTAVCQQAWQAAVDSALSTPDGIVKMAAVHDLISDTAVSHQAQEVPALQTYLRDCIKPIIVGDSIAAQWSLFQAGLEFNAFSKSLEQEILQHILFSLEQEVSFDNAFRALELISHVKPNLVGVQSEIHVVVITRLLALSEISDRKVASRARSLTSIIDKANDVEGQQGAASNALIHVVQGNLGSADPQSLSTDVLIKQAKQILATPEAVVDIRSLLPDMNIWRHSLDPLLVASPHTILGLMRPFAGAVYLVQPDRAKSWERLARDGDGCSIALRMALYSTGIIIEHFEILPEDILVEMMILMGVTANLVSDQLDLNEDNKLVASNRNMETIATVREFIDVTFPAACESIVMAATDWHDQDIGKGGVSTSSIMHRLISRLVEAAEGLTSTAFYSARFLSQLLARLVDAYGWSNRGDEWLLKLGVLKPSVSSVLGATAALTGLGNSLSSSKVAITFCNRLVSDVTEGSVESEKTLQLLVLLNASLDVYGQDELPITHSRLVFVVQKILSWTHYLPSKNLQMAAEVCRALQHLLPAIRSVYGDYWENTIKFCISIWDLVGVDLDERLPSIGASLKLIHILQSLKKTDESLEDGNDDLKDSIVQYKDDISRSVLSLLSLPRCNATQALDYVDGLLMRSISNLPIQNLNNPSGFYPFIASNFPKVQSMAFDVLHRAMPAAQEQVAIDVMVAKKVATLPEELLSLLLDAPLLENFADDELIEFPPSIRGYLYTWLLIYTAYEAAPHRIRNDYTEILKASSYVSPLLTFLFDMFGHSVGSPLNLDKHHFDSIRIRTYDAREGLDTETNERNMQWLLSHLYYLSLKFVPNLVKAWWMDCKSKQTRLAVISWTEKYFSPLIIEDTIEGVRVWARQQDLADEDKPLNVKMLTRSREIFAGYDIDDTQIQIVVRLSTAYPLEGVKVEGVNRVAVSEKKWTSWLMITQGVITFSNGSITDGLSSFHKNVTGALKGQTECAICYSIIGSDRKTPDKQCQTCRNLFHSDCLFKWFASSNQSTCPLCRNTFNYASGRRRGVGEGGGE